MFTAVTLHLYITNGDGILLEGLPSTKHESLEKALLALDDFTVNKRMTEPVSHWFYTLDQRTEDYNTGEPGASLVYRIVSIDTDTSQNPLSQLRVRYEAVIHTETEA